MPALPPTQDEIDKIGEPKKAPCASCHDSGSDCILTRSRRGGNFRHHRTGSGVKDSISGKRPGTSGPSVGWPGYISSPTVHSSGHEEAGEEAEDVLIMELRNPSDALHILALSGEIQSPNSQRGRSSTVTSPRDGLNCVMQDIGVPASNEPRTLPSKPATTVFDDYELAQRGLLGPSLVYELIHRYSRYYHPYCPIVPSYMLLSSNVQKLQKTDYFLLTAILTIASRDGPRHALTHRYCWDHAQRLLIDVLLAHPWTQTPRTVEGLLLLAEWLPHIQIQDTASEVPKNLLSEDRTAWSLVGLAIRHGYLQHLDQGAFRSSSSNVSKERAEQDRLVWAYIFVADRQISVRLGQSFWSRGPSLGTKFTAQDFPSLQPRPGSDDEDYTSVLQATMELVQILHNAQALLYSSKERTLDLVCQGYYVRYLDDFRTSATTWHSTWCGLAVSAKIMNTLLIMYEASDPRMSDREQQNRRPFAELLSNGIMSSPDGRFIFDALSAASDLLSLMNGLDPRDVLCYLPSRYYLYGVYAAVLHKADCAGAFHSGNQRQEITSLAQDFISVLEKAPSTGSHICHSYSRMLKQLWSKRGRRHSRPRGQTSTPSNISTNHQHPPRSSQTISDQKSPSGHSNSEGLDIPQLFDPLGVDNDMLNFPSIEGYFLGSFMPGVADFSSHSSQRAFGQYPVPGGLQDLVFGRPRLEYQGSF
ncbi:hypothetical protein BDW62DRAFT_199113 [Aspergillus aurantiobrunneus]